MSGIGLAKRLEGRIGADPIVVAVFAFFIGHMVIRLFGTSNFSVDETMTAIHTQRFELFYVLRNPPLFDWLYFGFSRLLGNSLLTMQILKTALLAGGAVFFYFAVKPGFRHRSALAAAMASYGSTVFYGWEILQLYSHTNALIFAMGFTTWAFMRVVRRGQPADYVLLGVGLALGMLSKYPYFLYFVTLPLVALRPPAYRANLLSWRLLATLATGIVLLLPFLYGLSGLIDEAFADVGGRVAGGNGVVSSVANFALQSAQFWLPFVALLWVCLARWPGAQDASETGEIAGRYVDDDFYLLARDATLLMVAITLAAALFLGSRISAGHYLVPVLSLLPAAIFAAIDRRLPFPETAMKKFRQGAVVLMVGVAAARFLLSLFASPPFCVPRCVLFVDYTPVVERLKASGGQQTVVLSNDVHIDSNLLRSLPNARVIVAAEPDEPRESEDDQADGDCYFVWFHSYLGSAEQPLESALRRVLRRAPRGSELAAVGPADYVKVDWQTKLLRARGPDTMIGIAAVDINSPLCRGGQTSERAETVDSL